MDLEQDDLQDGAGMAESAQQLVAAATEKRGYREGWSDVEFLGRQVCKLMEELGELAHGIVLPQNEDLAFLDYEMENLGEEARDLFDSQLRWKNNVVFPVDGLYDMRKEAADMLVVLFNLAETISRIEGYPFDLVEAAKQKALDDIKRGVR